MRQTDQGSLLLEHAPMEGSTGYVYRCAHHKYFPGADVYYAPFVSANHSLRLQNRELRDLLPDNNQGIRVLPQLMCNQADHFIWACEVMRDLGYDEVNLNAGCPSSTVVAKRKGAGMLASLCDFEAFLHEVFDRLDRRGIRIGVSVKTRLGLQDPSEMEELTELYNRYPLSRLIIHARLRKDYYKGSPDRETFWEAAGASRHRISYNGDIFSEEDFCLLAAEAGRRGVRLDGVMCGRGVLANPSLMREIRGGRPAGRQELEAFAEELWQNYCSMMGNAGNAVFRMKELWGYLASCFRDSDRLLKTIRKTKKPEVYEAAVREIFLSCPLAADEKSPCK